MSINSDVRKVISAPLSASNISAPGRLFWSLKDKLTNLYLTTKDVVFKNAQKTLTSVYFWRVHSDTSQQASKIQAIFRGYSLRKKMAHQISAGFLPKTIRSEISNYLKRPIDAPRALGGNTPVYLPEELPEVVIKEAGRQSYRRLCQMNHCRTICEQNEFKHLVIPKAQLHGLTQKLEPVMIVEERLPIQVSSFFQASLYSAHREQFTDAIAELTHFIFQTGVTDLIGHNCIIRDCPSAPRYDNFPPIYYE